jgi:hypothetical protein
MGERLIEPIFSGAPESGLPRPRVRLSPEAVFRGAETSGWLSSPGGPLLFWWRRDEGRAVVLTLDRPAIHAAVNGWLAAWAREAFAPVEAGGGPDALWSPDERTVLATVGSPGGAGILQPPAFARIGSGGAARGAAWSGGLSAATQCAPARGTTRVVCEQRVA